MSANHASIARIRLRSALASAGAVLESPSIEFGEDSDSQLVENLLASVSQHQRQKNGEQTKNRMRSRMLNGYWVFQAPLGYRFERQSGGGKRLARNEPFASIIKEALEGFTNGRFGSRAEVKYFLESKPLFPTGRHGVVTNERVNHLLSQVLYMGHIEYPKWDVPLRKAQHERIISLETYERIMDAENTTIIKAYEGKVDALERKKLILREKIEKCGTPIRDYQSSFQTTLKFLANPWNFWETGRIEDRRAMMKLVFGGRITFDRKSGFQTPEISLPFKMLTGLSGLEKTMVPLPRKI